MPYEKIGCQVIGVLKDNFKIIKLFLAQMSTLVNNSEYFLTLGEDLSKIKVNL